MMAANIKDLCRLCAKKEEPSKDLLDANNKTILKLIQDFIQITVNVNDVLPTRVCLSCEEKIVSFQLFILECYKIQDSLKKVSLQNFSIKLETETADLLSNIKSEVKDELSAEDIVLRALDNNSSLPDYEDGYDSFDEKVDLVDNVVDNNKEDNDDDNEEEYDETDNITLADLKKSKGKNKPVQQNKEKEVTDENIKELNEILKRPNLKVKDFVKMHCYICDAKIRTWVSLQEHYAKKHKCNLFVKCICGYSITSKSMLYKHVLEHKLEGDKLRNTADDERPSDVNFYNLKVKDFVDFTCSLCGKKCSSWYSLNSHSQRVHKILPMVQCVCGVSLSSKTVLYKHVQDHKNPNIYCCDKCPRITKTLEALNKHKMSHVPKSERKFYCDSCDKVFNSKDGLKSHQKSHIPVHERKIYRCTQCDLRFTTQSSAAAHKRVVHDKIKSYVCDLCGYACGTNGELRQHRAIHSEDKPFTCPKCYKSFKTHSNLSTHMDTHEDTSYTCGVCSRVLNSRRTLRKHLLVHEERCKHVCSFCHKAFKRRQTLKVHLYTHTGDKPLNCKWCDERFAYASTLRSHRLRCHQDKMVPQVQINHYQEHYVPPEEYIKSDLAAIGVAKDESEVL